MPPVVVSTQAAEPTPNAPAAPAAPAAPEAPGAPVAPSAPAAPEAPAARDGATVEYAVRAVLFPYQKSLISSEVDSTIARYQFREGDVFDAGVNLIQLDDSIYKLRKERGEAALDAARAAQDYMQTNLALNKKLFSQGAVGQEMLSRCEFECKDATSKVILAQNEAKMYDREFSLCRIKAPFTGRMVKWLVREYEFVKAGQPVCEIIDDYQLLAVVNLPSSECLDLRKGMERSIRIDETGTLRTGTIHDISGVIDPVSRTMEIKILLDNADHKLYSGMSGVLLIKQGDVHERP